MNDKKQCTVCKEIKPLTDFHIKTGKKRQSRCKKCHNEIMKQYGAYGSAETPAHELRAIKWLESVGIPAVRGRDFPGDGYQFVDVVAFGCIRVEIKLPQKDGRIYFTHNQRDNVTFDVVVIERNKRTYHVYPADYHKFLYPTGDYIPALSLEPIDYEGAINRIDIIELALAKSRIALRQKHVLKVPKQMSLIPEPLADSA